MIKKIFLIGVIVFSIILFSASFAEATTYQTFVGVQIISARTDNTNLGSAFPNNSWCLGGFAVTGNTTALTIGTGTVTNDASSSNCTNFVALSSIAASGTTNGEVIKAVVCPVGSTGNYMKSNNIMWSGLVSLNTSSSYVARISTNTYGGCPGYLDGYNTSAHCIVAADTAKSCTETCASIGSASGQAADCYNNGWVTRRDGFEFINGKPCTNYTSVAGTLYDYINVATNTCYYVSGSGTPTIGCAAPPAGNIRLCRCLANNTNNTFYFPFVTPATF